MISSRLRRGVEFARLALAAAYAVEACSGTSGRASSPLALVAAARHALQAGVVLTLDGRSMHRIARLVDGVHALSMGLLWMASPSHERFASRQLLGALGMVLLESLAAGGAGGRRR